MKAPHALLVCGLASAALPFLAHGSSAGLRGLAVRDSATHHPHSLAREEVDGRSPALLDPLRRRLDALTAKGVRPQTNEDEDDDGLGGEEDFGQDDFDDDEGNADELRRSLEPRKGGGGGGGRSGGGGGGGGGGGKSGGGSKSGGSSSSKTSNAGGASKAGSGQRPLMGGYYPGGAAVPYQAGKKSTGKGLLPGALLGGVAAVALFPGLWLWSVYPYTFPDRHDFVNQSAANATFPAGVNETLPVVCLCQQYAVCGCDGNDNATYFDALLGNGSYPALNKSLVNLADVNGTKTIVINGSLENGTTAATGSAAGLLLRGGGTGWASWWLIVVLGLGFYLGLA